MRTAVQKTSKQLREAQNHETIVEGQRLRKADIMESNPLTSVCLERWSMHREKGKVRRNSSGGFKRY